MTTCKEFRPVRSIVMIKLRFSRLALLLVVFGSSPASLISCSWASGYFYQVTALRGTVVGFHFQLFQPRWLRQRIVRPNVKISLFTYSERQRAVSLPIGTTTTDKNGHFDFGPIPVGHYTLTLSDPAEELGDRFDVEVIASPRSNEALLIDISPVHPDCQGGHEIVEIRE